PPATPLVMITAHGISDRERQRLEQAGKQLIDTTCPLVLKVHRAARILAAEGRHVLIIGRPGHVEVLGILEDLDSGEVVESAAADLDANWFRGCRVVGLTAGTSTLDQTVEEIRRELLEMPAWSAC